MTESLQQESNLKLKKTDVKRLYLFIIHCKCFKCVRLELDVNESLTESE